MAVCAFYGWAIIRKGVGKKNNIMQQEEWKDIIGFGDIYQISNYGNVKVLSHIESMKNGKKRNKSEKIIKIRPDSRNKYLLVDLGSISKGTRKTRLVHRLVATAFLGAIPKGMEVNHIDGNHKNNHYSNLEIVTHKENDIHKRVVLKRISRPMLGRKGILCPRSISIVQIDPKDNHIIHYWESISEAARKGKFDLSSIAKCCKTNLKQHKGFIWKYQKDL